MRFAYFPFDFVIIFIATWLTGFLLSIFLFDNGIPNFKNARLLPYAYSFLITSVIFAVSIGDLPLKFYIFNRFKYSYEAQLGPSPQGINPQGIIFLIAFLFSAIVNVSLFIIAISLIFKHNRWRNQKDYN